MAKLIEITPLIENHSLLYTADSAGVPATKFVSSDKLSMEAVGLTYVLPFPAEKRLADGRLEQMTVDEYQKKFNGTPNAQALIQTRLIDMSVFPFQLYYVKETVAELATAINA